MTFSRFLLARLHMDSLAMAITPGSVRRILHNLPSTYSVTYKQAMHRISAQHPEDAWLANCVLIWTAFAIRPLSVSELRQAISVRWEQKDLDILECPDEELLTSVCAGLVIIDQQTKLVRLVHKTTQEFFVENSATYFTDLQKTMASICISYLKFGPGRGPCETQEDYEKFLQQYKFFTYAARHWGDHARGDPEDSLQDELKSFLGDKEKVMSAIQSRNVGLGNSTYDLYPRKVTTLSYVASFGLSRLAARILKSAGPQNLNVKDSFGATPLLRASEAGYTEVIAEFLKNGADPNISGSAGVTPLIAAAFGGFEHAVLVLLQHGADASARSYGWTIRGTALDVALDQGHGSVALALLEAMSDTVAGAEQTPFGDSMIPPPNHYRPLEVAPLMDSFSTSTLRYTAGALPFATASSGPGQYSSPTLGPDRYTVDVLPMASASSEPFSYRAPTGKPTKVTDQLRQAVTGLWRVRKQTSTASKSTMKPSSASTAIIQSESANHYFRAKPSSATAAILQTQSATTYAKPSSASAAVLQAHSSATTMPTTSEILQSAAALRANTNASTRMLKYDPNAVVGNIRSNQQGFDGRDLAYLEMWGRPNAYPTLPQQSIPLYESKPLHSGGTAGQQSLATTSAPHRPLTPLSEQPRYT